MKNSVRITTSKMLALCLACIMIISLIPIGMLFNASAAVVSTFTVELPAGIDASVKIVNADDTEDFLEVVSTNSSAVFNDFVDLDKLYSITFTKMEDYKDFDDVINPINDKYTLSSSSLTMKDEQTISFETVEINKAIGDDPFINTITAQGDGTGAITFESGNESVATVANDGTVTILSLGSAIITVKKATDDNYKAATASYTLNVGKIKDYLSFASSEYSYTYGATDAGQPVQKGNYSDDVVYSVTDESIASINESGKLDIKKAGETTVTATAAENSNHESASASYTLKVSQKTINVELNLQKNYGEADPTTFSENEESNIKTQIKGGIVEEEKDEIANNLFDLITSIGYETDYENNGEYRPVGEHNIIYTVSDTDDCYKLDITGKLSVDETVLSANDNKDYTVSGWNSDNWGKKVTITAAEGYVISKSNNGGWSASIDYSESSAKVNQTFYIRKTGGKSKIVKCTENFGVDTTNPKITRFEIKKENDDPISKILHFLTFGFFFNKQVKIVVIVEDEGDSSGLKEITLYAGEKSLGTVDVLGGQGEFIIPAEEITDEKMVLKSVISAKVTDKVGNTSADKVQATTDNSDLAGSELMIETIKPEISITTEPKVKYNDGAQESKDWYAGDIEFNISVFDNDSGLGFVSIALNDKLVDETYYGLDSITKENSFILNTEDPEVTINKDGSYKLTVSVIDNAGNIEEKTLTVYKDTTAPEITGFKFEAKGHKDGTGDAKDYETDYGFYFVEDTKVTVTANDSSPASGVKEITYYTVDINNVKSEETTKSVNDPYIIPAKFKGQIYAKATDNVDNASKFVTPNGVILETQEQHDNTGEHIGFSKSDATYKTSEGSDLYKNDVPVTVTVKDEYNGIRSIEWKVDSPFDKVNNKSGSVSIGNAKSLSGDTGWEIKTNETDNLVYEMSKTITVTNDSNNIKLFVKMTDRAGNTSEKVLSLNIDKTAPVVTVKMNDNDSDKNAGFFNSDRQVDITVKERNFTSNGVFKVTVTDDTGVKKGLDISADFALETPENPSKKDDKGIEYYVYTMKYTFKNDGDYTFEISEINDLANHKVQDEKVSYVNESNEEIRTICNRFTVDQTIPRVSVVYDNNNAKNNNYYNADRIATITIEEHNFDAEDVMIIGKATDNATGSEVATAFPKESGWKNNGNNTYSATIHYSNDSKYVFDIEFVDMAGNSINDFAPQTFFVDKTMPTIDITGVADRSANNGAVTPIIRIFDTNFEKENVSIVLSGINNGQVNYSNIVEEIINGQNITYNDFERVKNVDDIYTLTAKLTDMAGNETTKAITFSVNRFGSVYDISGLKDIISKYLQKEKDIVFTETNVDSLEREGIKIKLTKNGTPTDLVEGTDYTVDVSGGNGQWSVYTYTISKKLFANDGRYSISIYSKDAAGNINENIDETKEAEISFGIDKTKPVIVPIDFESGVQYPVETKTVSIEIKDNLVLDGVKIYLNDKEVKYNVDGETYTFDIPEKNEKQNVRIVAVDAAGNEEELLVAKFLVSTNIFVRWYNNTPLFVGSIAGIVLIAGAAAFFVFRRRKVA